MDKPKKPNRKLQNERELRGWSQQSVAEAVGTDFKRVSAWERGENTPGPYYRAKLCALFGKNAEELGFLDEEASGVASTSQEEPPTPAPLVKDFEPGGHQPIQLFIPNSSNSNAHAITIHIHQQAPVIPSRYPVQNDIIDSGIVTTLREAEDTVNRRDFTRKALSIATTAFLTDDVLNAELLERFNRALKKPTTVDERFLTYLEMRTGNYWGDRQSAVLASSDLLSYVMEHFEKILTLLEASLLPAVRIRLCAIASRTALLVGELLLDLSYYARARGFQRSAINSAQEANNKALEAISWGRLSLGWIYGNDAQNSLTCVQKAHSIAPYNSTLTNAWLAAIEAEAQADLHNQDACLKALDEAEHIEGQRNLPEDSYLIAFDRSLLEGYQGACFRKLYHPDDVRSAIYLERAQSILMDALARLDISSMLRQPTFLADLASTYAKKGEVEEACRRATEALTIAAPVKLQKVVKRLSTLQKDLQPWSETQHVKDLDERLSTFLTSNR